MTPCRLSDGMSMTDEMDNVEHWSSMSAGYLSSFVAVETGVGLQSCPWLIDVPPGRQVNVTLLSFSPPWPGGEVTRGCEWTIVVREANVTTHLPGCVGGSSESARRARRRQRVLYTSHRRGTPLTVYLQPTTTSSSLRSHLLLYVQGSFL